MLRRMVSVNSVKVGGNGAHRVTGGDRGNFLVAAMSARVSLALVAAQVSQRTTRRCRPAERKLRALRSPHGYIYSIYFIPSADLGTSIEQPQAVVTEAAVAVAAALDELGLVVEALGAAVG
jgi:hypothetical protein